MVESRHLVKLMKSSFQEQAAEPPISFRSTSATLRAALDLPPGPSFVSYLWASMASGQGSQDERSEDFVPALVMVVITRVTPSGSLIPAFALVDRTCLGVKDAFLGAPRTREELEGDLARLAEVHGPIRECPLLLAQSVVFHAIEYARTLGFEPHEGFEAALFGPRPKALIETPFSSPAYPIYIVGPGDPVEEILETLDRAVGSFNYAFMSGEPVSSEWDSFSHEGEERGDDRVTAAAG